MESTHMRPAKFLFAILFIICILNFNPSFPGSITLLFKSAFPEPPIDSTKFFKSIVFRLTSSQNAGMVQGQKLAVSV